MKYSLQAAITNAVTKRVFRLYVRHLLVLQNLLLNSEYLTTLT